MGSRFTFIIGLLLLSMGVLGPVGVRAAPLAVSENIKAIKAKPPDLARGFSFVVLGDSRDGAEAYHRLLQRAATLKPLFILHTGDFVKQGQPSEYENYAKQIADFPIPILHLPGNHDVQSGMDVYRRYVGEPNWYFDLAGYRIIALDNAAGDLGENALTFAHQSLTSRKICLFAFHKPPSLGRWKVHSMKGDPAKILNLMEKMRVPLVFLGHIHLYDEMDVGGTKYIISAGGGAPLHEKYNFGKAEYGFVVVTVTPTAITHRWIPLDHGGSQGAKEHGH